MTAQSNIILTKNNEAIEAAFKNFPASTTSGKSGAFMSKVNDWINEGRALFIDFNTDWHNGTGYFNALTRIKFHQELLKLPLGQVILTYSNDNRRIMIIVGRYGNVVIFDRYTNGDHDIFVANSDDAYRLLLPTGALSADDLFRIMPSPAFSEKRNIYFQGVIYDHEDIRRNILIHDFGIAKASELLGYSVRELEE